MATVTRSFVADAPGNPPGRKWQMQEEWISPKLKSIAEQFRHYRSAGSAADEEGRGGIVSSVGMPISVASQNDIKVFPTNRRAAVLVCLFQTADGELRVILTKRAGSLSSHSGEVSLPGGKRDKEDVDDEATALREAKEEIGLQPSDVRVVTSLEPFLSKHLLTVIPVVGLLDDTRQFKPVPNPGEVDSIFDAPLEMFLKVLLQLCQFSTSYPLLGAGEAGPVMACACGQYPGFWSLLKVSGNEITKHLYSASVRALIRQNSDNHWFKEREWLGVKYRIHFFDYTTDSGEKFLIWGLTASILIQAASRIFNREPDFVEFIPDFSKILKSSEGMGLAPITKPDSADDNTTK